MNSSFDFPLNIEIRDYLGRQILIKTVKTRKQFVEVDLSGQLDKGTYLLRLSDQFQHKVRKIVKVK